MLQVAKSKNVLLFVTYSNYKTKYSSFLFDIFLLFLIIYLFPHMKSVFYFPKSCSLDQETMKRNYVTRQILIRFYVVGIICQMSNNGRTCPCVLIRSGGPNYLLSKRNQKGQTNTFFYHLFSFQLKRLKMIVTTALQSWPLTGYSFFQHTMSVKSSRCRDVKL